MAVATDPRLDEIKEVAKGRGVEFFFAQFVDMYGRPSAKLVPAANLDSLVTEGAGFAGFAAGEIGQMPSDPDIAAIPDLDSFTLVPWQQNLARFACDVTVEGEPWPYCPRTILRNQIARAKELGYDFKIGIELEYFLINRNEDGSIQIADSQDTLDKPCYDMAGLTRRYDFLTTVSKYCNEMGWGNYANDHEDANGQFEQNFEFDDARRDLVAGVDLVRLQQPDADAPHPGARPDRGPHDRRLRESVSRGDRGAGRRPRRDRARAGRGRAELGEPLHEVVRGAHRARAAHAAGEPARGDRRARGRRRHAPRARPRARGGLHRLLRAGQARRVVPVSRAGHVLGDHGVPDALLGMEKSDIPGRRRLAVPGRSVRYNVVSMCRKGP